MKNAQAFCLLQEQNRQLKELQAAAAYGLGTEKAEHPFCAGANCVKSCRIAERINNEWRIQMSTYLVDFENVGVGGMDGVEKLSDHDRVVIFYGKQAAAVPFERHIEIASSRAEVRYIKVDKTGKNFLDFQLSSYCGYLIGSTAEKDFIIVSRDNGFGSMEDFWDGKEMSGKLISMKRQPAIAVNEEKAESVREIIVDRSERAGEKAKEQEIKSSREKSGQTEQGRREKEQKKQKKADRKAEKEKHEKEKRERERQEKERHIREKRERQEAAREEMREASSENEQEEASIPEMRRKGRRNTGKKRGQRPDEEMILSAAEETQNHLKEESVRKDSRREEPKWLKERAEKENGKKNTKGEQRSAECVHEEPKGAEEKEEKRQIPASDGGQEGEKEARRHLKRSRRRPKGRYVWRR